MKTIYILGPDLMGGVQNFCLDFESRIRKFSRAKVFFYTIDFSKFSSFGTQIGGRSRTKDQAQHVWRLLDIKPQDVIVCNDGRELLWVGASGISNPVIYVMHGDYKAYYDAVKLNGHLCDLIICINKGVLGKLAFDIVREKLFYLPQIFKHSDKNLEELTALKSQNLKPRIAFIGRAHEVKGFDILEQAIIRYPRFNFEVILSGDGLIPMTIISAENVTIHTNICHDDVLAILERCNHLFFPSRREGLPLSILESLSAGCSVSCLNLVGFVEAFMDCERIHISKDCDHLVNALPQHTSIGNVADSVGFSRKWRQYSSDSIVDLYDIIARSNVRNRRPVRYSKTDFLPKWIMGILRTAREIGFK
jgi:glycosyltransferase involved in cell wall biosynthesis